MLTLEALDLRWRGRKGSGPCPFCDHAAGRKPFGIALDEDNPDRGTWGCLRCKLTGHIVDRVLYNKGERPDRAPGRASQRPRVPALPPPPRRYDPPVPAIGQLLWRVFEVYEQQYQGSAGQAYMRGRHFHTDPPRIGYAPGGFALRDAGFNLELLWNLGLVAKDGRDRLWRRVVLPFTWQGRCTCLHGRAIDSSTPEAFRHFTTPCAGRPRSDIEELSDQELESFPWLRSTGRYQSWSWVKGVYNEAGLEADSFMLTEGPLDAAPAALAGHQHVVAAGGTAVSAVLSRLRPDQKVVVATDSDDAGEAAFQQIQAELVWQDLNDSERRVLRALAFTPTRALDETYRRNNRLADGDEQLAIALAVRRKALVCRDARGTLHLPNSYFRRWVQLHASGPGSRRAVFTEPPTIPPDADVEDLGGRAVRQRVPDGCKDWADYLGRLSEGAASTTQVGGGSSSVTRRPSGSTI